MILCSVFNPLTGTFDEDNTSPKKVIPNKSQLILYIFPSNLKKKVRIFIHLSVVCEIFIFHMIDWKKFVFSMKYSYEGLAVYYYSYYCGLLHNWPVFFYFFIWCLLHFQSIPVSLITNNSSNHGNNHTFLTFQNKSMKMFFFFFEILLSRIRCKWRKLTTWKKKPKKRRKSILLHNLQSSPSSCFKKEIILSALY